MGKALVKGYRLFSLLNEALLREKWTPLYCLMTFFLLAYAYVFFVMGPDTPLSFQAIVGCIFFFGSLFVYLSVCTVERISKHLIDSKAHLRACCDQISSKSNEAMHERKLAQEANEAKSMFLAHMSHEVKTPLTAIEGFIELIRINSENKGQVTSYLNAVTRNISHLQALIEDILNLSHIESGKLIVRKKTISLKNELGVVHSTFAQQAKQKGLVFKIELENPVPSEVFTDALRLKQILFNLIGNAVKFTPHGHVLVKVSYQAKETGGSPILSFDIDDSGPGVPPESEESIFSPFKQIYRDTDDLAKGSGLGLSIARNLARLLGGDVCYHRKKNGNLGAHFEFKIPIEHDPEVSFFSQF